MSGSRRDDATRLRVAIDARPTQPGFLGHEGRGIGRYAVELVAALARRADLSMELWYQQGLELPAAGVPAGASTRMLPRLPLPMRDRLSSQITVPLAMRATRADLVHVLAHTDAPAWPSARSVVTVHDLILELFPHLYAGSHSALHRVARGLEARALAGARVLVADSASTRDDLVRLHGLPPERIRVAHLAVSERFKPPAAAEVAALRQRLALPERFVLYVGGIDARKNVATLVDAFGQAQRRGLPPDVALVLAGRFEHAAEWPALRERAAALGEAFRPVGFVGDADLPALLGSATVFAFPSLYEGFGLPPLEAMACGTAVVSSSAGSLAEVVGDAAVVAAPDDPAAFADAILRLVADPEQAAALAARGRARAATFTWDACAAATVEAYRMCRAG